MKARIFLQLGLIASVAFLASCSKTPGSADLGANGGLSAHGIGGFKHFAGQQAGESYTTQAPHNQLYLFSYDNSTITSKYLPSIHAQAEYLRANPGARILIAGHTDEKGSREYNVALGERRANAIAEVIRLDGVKRNQIRVVSYGKEHPANFGHDDASHAQNRRAELTYESTR